MAAPRRRRRLPLWLPAAGALLGVTILLARLTTAPLDQTSPYLAVLVVGLAAVVIGFTARVVRHRNRMRAVVAAHPGGLVMPIVGGVDTSAATRWLAEHLGDPHLALRPERNAFVVVDGSGLRLTDGSTTSTLLPAGMLSVLPLTTARAGLRQVDALVVGVAVGDVIAPLPLVPARSSPFATGALTDPELLEVSGRIRNSLAGEQDVGRWNY
jgi:hypothetical protein